MGIEPEPLETETDLRVAARGTSETHTPVVCWTSRDSTEPGWRGGVSLPLPRPPLPRASRGAGGSTRGGGGAPGLRPRVGCCGCLGCSGTPGPRVEASLEQVSVVAGTSPSRSFPKCDPEFPIPQKGTPRPRGDSVPASTSADVSLGLCFQFCYSVVGMGIASSRCAVRSDCREEGEAEGPGTSSPQPFGMRALGIRSEPFFGRLAFLICEMKAPTSSTAETPRALHMATTLCPAPGQ